jgi:hypothetical protein
VKLALSVTALFVLAFLSGAVCGDPNERNQQITTADFGTATPQPAASPSPSPVEPTREAVATEVPAANPTTTPVLLPTDAMLPSSESLPLDVGQIAEGGYRYRIGGWTVQIPSGYEFRYMVGVGDPGGTQLIVLFDPATGSAIRFSEDGKEVGRYVGDPSVAPVLDWIASSVATQ